MKTLYNLAIGVTFRLQFLSLIFVIIGNNAKSQTQCAAQVTHLQGTKTINGVAVTVTAVGTVDSNVVYCPATKPYFIGYTYAGGGNGNGSYQFSFTPPVSAVTFNVSGISNVPGSGIEEIIVNKNRAHYTIPAAGVADSCDPLAVLTAEGNIAGCGGCGVSGWSEITVPGPLTMVEIKDTVLYGSPEGSIFSLFICGPATNINELSAEAQLKVFPNPFVNNLSIASTFEKQLQFIMYDIVSRRVIQETFTGSSSITTNQLPQGIYFYEINDGVNTIRQGKIIKD